VQVITIDTDGMLAQSAETIPVDPTPSTPATNSYDGGWNCNNWTDNE
jgi:hypothetical protein